MRLRPGVAIDLGTVNTLVSVAGQGLVVEEPSAVALDRATGSVAAVGKLADALAGKEPVDVEVIYPLRDGVIADLEASTAMLHAFLRRARVRRRRLHRGRGRRDNRGRGRGRRPRRARAVPAPRGERDGRGDHERGQGGAWDAPRQERRPAAEDDPWAHRGRG